MTVEQARAFVEEAETLPIGEVDAERLAEALDVLAEAVEAETEPTVDLGPVVDALGEVARTQAAQKIPADAKDPALLAPFFRVLTDALGDLARTQATQKIPSNVQYLARATALAEQAMVRAPALPLATREREAGVTRATAQPTPTSRLAFDFRQRLFRAAEGAGVSVEEVDAIAAEARQAVDAVQAGIEETGQPPPPGMASTIEEALEDQIAAWEAQAAAKRGPPIGVPFDFVAQPVAVLTPADRALTGLRTATAEARPQYFAGHELVPSGMSPETLVQFQARLVAAGLLDEGEYWPGVWDTKSSEAYATVLGLANQSGHTDEYTIDRLIETLPQSIKEQRARAKLAKTFQAPGFIGPDYASLAQEVKRILRSKLGRDPSDAEMAELTKVMSGIYRKDFEAEVAVQRATFEAEAQSLATGQPVTPAAATDLDPAAQFAEFFERRFKPESDRLDALRDVRANTVNVFESLRTMGSLIGGSR